MPYTHIIALCSIVIFLGGCAGTPALSHSPEIIREHVIAVDHNGRPHDPNFPDGPEYSMRQYRSQIQHIFQASDVFFAHRSDRKFLIFVHGGLNSPADSLANADSEMNCVMAAGYYPIYLDWDSGILSTYGEHILSITQGEDETWPREVLAPAYVLADLGRAATRIPIVWINQFASDIQAAGSDIIALPKRRQLESTTQPDGFASSQRWAAGDRGKALAKMYQQLRAAQAIDERNPVRTELRVYIGPDYDVRPLHMAELGATYALTLPAKLALQPVIDWLGTPAWQVMARRTLIAFDGDLGANPTNPELAAANVAQREKRDANPSDFSSIGAMEVFREQLLQTTGVYDPETTDTTRPTPTAYEITLVGHSMGTMVLNEWLRRDMLKKKQPYYAHIVYMAAACSIRDFSRAVIPYLLQHSTTQFFNLMLHPLADLRERGTLYDLPPRGSLLVWLDDFLTDPQTPLDRTLGRWDNLVNATAVIPQAARKQINLKAFALAPSNKQPPPPGQPNYGPQEHGQFRGNPYWSPDFWAGQHPIVENPPCPSTQPCP
jgi:hypothetical protein